MATICFAKEPKVVPGRGGDVRRTELGAQPPHDDLHAEQGEDARTSQKGVHRGRLHRELPQGHQRDSPLVSEEALPPPHVLATTSSFSVMPSHAVTLGVPRMSDVQEKHEHEDGVSSTDGSRPGDEAARGAHREIEERHHEWVREDLRAQLSLVLRGAPREDLALHVSGAGRGAHLEGAALR